MTFAHRSFSPQRLAANDPRNWLVLVDSLSVNPIADIVLLVDAYQPFEKLLSYHVITANDVQFFLDGTG
jgi:hypothetical protein